MTFGNKLQALRAEAGLSQEELAARLGVSRALLGRDRADGTELKRYRRSFARCTVWACCREAF